VAASRSGVAGKETGAGDVSIEQLSLFAILAAMLALFAWNRWRYDVVALMGLMAATLAGLVPPGETFAGLGHPAVVTVAAVLVLSRGLLNAGVVDLIARQLTRVSGKPTVQVAMLTGIVALCSGFMNNVGALALFMPVAVWMSRKGGRSPSILLMPLAFGSLLGGTLTLIGTPPNIIIAAYRGQTQAPPFGMFDFLPVGLGLTLVGLLFIVLLGWRLTPQRKEGDDSGDLFEISDYLTELRVPEGCKFAGHTLHELQGAVEDDAEVQVVGLVREGRRQQQPSRYKILQEGDILLVEADSDSLTTLIDVAGLELAAEAETSVEGRESRLGDLDLVEAIVTSESILVGRTAFSMGLRELYGVSVLAVARQGKRLKERLGKIRFLPGDILLVQGSEESLQSSLKELGCLPLASRGLRIPRPGKVLLAVCIFAAALTAVVSGLVPVATALTCGAVAMVLTGLLSAGEAYESVDMSIIVLLAAMLPIGQALESTGGSRLIAEGLSGAAQSMPAAGTIALLMGAVMLLSNVVNNAAAAVLAAPVAISLARSMEASADPFLMAVAVGASCAFLTPIGHQSNALVMVSGGYRFGDYWRMGFPLSVLVVGTAVPLILWVWPL
ncbi:MAG: SLC13 family permease, partial [Desulfohalobiaceae bacterium]